jgi:hypothetical protein
MRLELHGNQDNKGVNGVQPAPNSLDINYLILESNESVFQLQLGLRSDKRKTRR